MADIDVDKLNDAELRTKLVEYGFPVMPITGTTRKLMVKKLKLLLDNNKKISGNASGRRSLGKFSSEEDSDTDVAAAKANKNRRITMAAPTIQAPKAATRKSTRVVDTPVEEEPPIVVVPKKKEIKSTSFSSSSRTTRIVKAAQDEFDTGSDSESEIIVEDSDNSKVGYNSSYTLPTVSTRHSPKKTLDTSYSRSFTSPSSKPAAFSSPVLESTSDRLTGLRSRMSLGTGGYSRSTFGAVTEEPIEKADTPFLANFTRRLSQLSNKRPDYKADIKEQDTNGGSVFPRTQYSSFRTASPRPSTRDYNYDYNKAVQSGVLKNNLVPFAVLAVAFLFFIFVAIMYLGIRSDTTLEPADFNIPHCKSQDSSYKRGINCILKEDAETALYLLKALKPELEDRAVKKICSQPKSLPYMTDDDVVDFIKDKFKQEEFQIRKDLRSLQVLVLHNSKWGISNIKITDNAEISEENVLKNLDNIGFEQFTRALVILKPSISWTCSFYNTFWNIAQTLLILGGLFGGLYGTNLGYKYYKTYAQKQRNDVIFMVERILDLLQSNMTEESDKNYFVINHVRDMIIPLNERKGKDNIWKQAVTFINDNESRVRTEVRIVQGEEYQVWRWVGSANLSINNAKNKSWQGQAFETQFGSQNGPPCSPTPCLKIRGMVEDGDRNTQVIREGILSKCANKCRILHCAVDTHMKCVYLKCQDTADAAVAYQNLHGWWYAGQLVTVKYLRLERYMQRYPDSPSSGPYLQSTGTGASNEWCS